MCSEGSRVLVTNSAHGKGVSGYVRRPVTLRDIAEKERCRGYERTVNSNSRRRLNAYEGDVRRAPRRIEGNGNPITRSDPEERSIQITLTGVVDCGKDLVHRGSVDVEPSDMKGRLTDERDVSLQSESPGTPSQRVPNADFGEVKDSQVKRRRPGAAGLERGPYPGCFR